MSATTLRTGMKLNPIASRFSHRQTLGKRVDGAGIGVSWCRSRWVHVWTLAVFVRREGDAASAQLRCVSGLLRGEAGGDSANVMDQTSSGHLGHLGLDNGRCYGRLAVTTSYQVSTCQGSIYNQLPECSSPFAVYALVGEIRLRQRRLCHRYALPPKFNRVHGHVS
ncbi:hypothetical protein OG21DRAFT_98407 [Imleria badia]|nr:hypothetical protein OG21DRAFT_98407 [Imleria badia]